MPQVELSIHIFQPSNEGPLDAEAEGDEASSSYCEWELPASAFCGLWESLIYSQVCFPVLPLPPTSQEFFMLTDTNQGALQGVIQNKRLEIVQLL